MVQCTYLIYFLKIFFKVNSKIIFLENYFETHLKDFNLTDLQQTK